MEIHTNQFIITERQIEEDAFWAEDDNNGKEGVDEHGLIELSEKRNREMHKTFSTRCLMKSRQERNE